MSGIMPGKDITMSSNTSETKKQQGKGTVRIIGIAVILLVLIALNAPQFLFFLKLWLTAI